MALVVLAYPEIARSDYVRIQNFRKDHDMYYSIVEPHFTLVFPFEVDWTIESFIGEIVEQSRGIRAFEFCIRCAVLNKDGFNDLYHAFLVPDEGYGKIARLHDRLCSGRLFPFRVLSIDFVPHIGVGNSKDPLRCLEMVEDWNRTEFTIPGRVAALDIANYEHDTVQTISRVILRGGSE